MQVKNLVKNYKLKSGVVEALRNISFDLADSGMVFVLGKSGSGKSTLLNVLSGMDSFDEGDIIFHGKSLKGYTAKEYDDHRSNHCGFVFQEYNLIPELNVEDNIGLALDIGGDKEGRNKIGKVLKLVGLEGYEKRKVTELSGGQKQRIAIARAIIKEPEIIFADEPSGALDSETGGEIFGILKELSKEKLVIVVTHDRESAERYGDRIIELSDGKIKSDSKAGYKAEEKTEDEKKPKKSAMPIKFALKIGCGNFKYHPIRLAVTVLLAMIAFVFFGISFIPVVNNNSVIMYDTMKKNGITQSTLRKYRQGEYYADRIPISGSDFGSLENKYGALLPVAKCAKGVENLGDDYPEEIYYEGLPVGYTVIDEAALGKFGFSLDGKLPSYGDEIAITKYTAETLSRYGFQEDPRNQTLVVDGKEFTICGIIDTKIDKKYQDLKATQYSETLAQQFSDELINGAHLLLFVNDLAPYVDATSIKGSNMLIAFPDDEYKQLPNVDRVGLFSQIPENDIVTLNSDDGFYFPSSLILQVLSRYDASFQKKFVEYIVERNGDSNFSVSDRLVFDLIEEHKEEFIGGLSVNFHLTLYNYSFRSLLKGFYFDNGKSRDFIADKSVYDEIYAQIGGIYDYCVIPTTSMSVKTLSELTDAHEEIYFGLDNYVVQTVSDIVSNINTLRKILTALSVVFAVFSIVLLLNFMSHSISDKTSTIGIIKSLGGSNFGLIKIFVWEGIVVGALIFGVSLIMLALTGWFFSMYFSALFGTVYVAVFALNLPIALILFGVIIVFSVIGCLLPIIKLCRLKPLEYMNKAL